MLGLQCIADSKLKRDLLCQTDIESSSKDNDFHMEIDIYNLLGCFLKQSKWKMCDMDSSSWGDSSAKIYMKCH